MIGHTKMIGQTKTIECVHIFHHDEYEYTHALLDISSYPKSNGDAIACQYVLEKMIQSDNYDLSLKIMAVYIYALIGTYQLSPLLILELSPWIASFILECFNRTYIYDNVPYELRGSYSRCASIFYKGVSRITR